MKPFGYIVYGGDYNPDQWIDTPEIWKEDMRLMRLAGINSATVGIFAWSLLEPAEGAYNFGWLDAVMDLLAENGIGAILATPSGARPPWMARKYPEVLRVEESGLRNEYGVRHNHCLTSPLYREKVRNINRLLAARYRNHPALTAWHISNEYSGACHCPLCQAAFRDWLRREYRNDLHALNAAWWNGFWSHRITDWEQISSPKYRGENQSPALMLCWDRFVSDSHVSFFENEIVPLRELTPGVPVTTNMMGLYDGINYQALAKHVDFVSYDSYPPYDQGDNLQTARTFSFIYDVYRSMGGGRPFFLMESTPSAVNHHRQNKLIRPGRLAQKSLQAVAFGADSVQYFQWRKSRGGHEKFHGAVVDHEGSENTRVFREAAALGETLKRLGGITGGETKAKVAVIFDWENGWAVKHYSGYNNERRDYGAECMKWHAPFLNRGIAVDVIAQTDDFSPYALVIAPYLYMLQPGTADRIRAYVENGGQFVATYLFAVADRNDLVFRGGLPGAGLREVFGVWAEETDSLPPDRPGRAVFNGKAYAVEHVCDVIHAEGAEILGEYASDFYAGQPAVTKHAFGKGTAYLAAFRNDGGFADDFCAGLIKALALPADADITAPPEVNVRRRGDYVFLFNFSDAPQTAALNAPFTDAVSGEPLPGEIVLPVCGWLAVKPVSAGN